MSLGSEWVKQESIRGFRKVWRHRRSFGRRELNRWYQDILLALTLDFLQFRKTFHVITPPFRCVHPWMLSLFTAFIREGGGNVWHTSAALDATSASKGCRGLCTYTPKTLVLMVVDRKVDLGGKVIWTQRLLSEQRLHNAQQRARLTKFPSSTPSFFSSG